MSLTLTIIGRPNVGKSTLFNRLTGKKHALVDDTPGLTRDRREGQGRIGDLHFTVIDTAGLEQAETASLEAEMMKSCERAMAQADILLFVIDGREGVLPDDQFFAEHIRKTARKPVILIANKCEGKKTSPALYESLRLGFGEPVQISGQHGEGMDGLLLAIESACSENNIDTGTKADEPEEKAINLAIIGRPNAGKSTLFNALIGDERSIVSPIAGTTRDAVTVEWEYKGYRIRLIDTAGMRKQSKRKQDKLEKLAIEDAERAVRFAPVVVLVIDGTRTMEKVDLQLAGHVLEEGRALVVAVNKWDEVKNKKQVLEDIAWRMEEAMAQAKDVPLIAVSALEKQGMGDIMREVFRMHRAWNKRVTTGKLNRWLEQATSAHLAPLAGAQRIRFKYITQVKTRPPTFALFSTSKISELPDSYLRYLTNDMRKAFRFEGVPIRILLRKQENPYAGRKKKD